MTADREDEADRAGGDGYSGACEEPGCPERAAVRLHVPWAEDRSLCPAHARPLARRDGVVAEPIEGAEGEWP